MGNKLSKPTWFLIFEYQVAKAYILRDSSENVSTSSDSWIQVVEFGEWEIPLFSLPQKDYYTHCLLFTTGPLQVLELSQLHAKRHTENVYLSLHIPSLSFKMSSHLPTFYLPSYTPTENFNFPESFFGTSFTLSYIRLLQITFLFQIIMSNTKLCSNAFTTPISWKF